MHEFFFENLRNPARIRCADLMHQFCSCQLDSTLPDLTNKRFLCLSRYQPYCKLDWDGTGASGPRGGCARDFVIFRGGNHASRARGVAARVWQFTLPGSKSGALISFIAWRSPNFDFLWSGRAIGAAMSRVYFLSTRQYTRRTEFWISITGIAAVLRQILTHIRL